ncbi:hypothetical protein [Streptomyces sp. NPDC001770]
MLNVDGLVRALPGLSEHVVPSGRAVNFEKIDHLLGTSLPEDFKELARSFPALEIGEFLRLWVPAPGDEDAYLGAVNYYLETLKDLADSGEAEGWSPYPAANGLIPWGSSLDGDIFYWCTKGACSEDWTVVANGSNGSWWEVGLSLISSIVGLIDGTCDSGELPDGAVSRESAVISLE